MMIHIPIFRPKVDDVQLTSGWETVKGEISEVQKVQDVHIDSSQLPLTTTSEGEQVCIYCSFFSMGSWLQ